MMKTLFLVFVAVSVVPQQTGAQTCDYTSSSSHITSCLNNYISGISCMSSQGVACFCPLYKTYFNCILQTPCLNAYTRSSISSTYSSYSSFLGGCSITYPTYRTSIYFSRSNFGWGTITFSTSQYVANCKNIFSRLGYSSTSYNSWCNNYGNWIKWYFGGRRRQAGDVRVEVTVPSATPLPPLTDVSSIPLSYQLNNTNMSNTVSVSNVVPSSSTTSSNTSSTDGNGNVVAGGNSNSNIYSGIPGYFPTPPPTNSATRTSASLFFALISAAVVLVAMF